MYAARLALATVVCGMRLAAAAATDSGAPSFSSAGLVNAATGQPVLAPYSICTLYGTNLFFDGSALATGRSQVPDTLAGVTVLIGMAPAGLFYVSASQINLLIPNTLGPGTYAVSVIRDGIGSAGVPVVVHEVAPGIFSVTHADGTLVAGSSPAIPGEVLIFYATGLGRTVPDVRDREILSTAAGIVHRADFQVLLDGVAIDPTLVQYVGVAPLNGGLYQVNVRMPTGLTATNPEVRFSVAGVLSPAGWHLATGASP